MLRPLFINRTTFRLCREAAWKATLRRADLAPGQVAGVRHVSQ
jgi:hypothetical protein